MTENGVKNEELKPVEYREVHWVTNDKRNCEFISAISLAIDNLKFCNGYNEY